MKKSKRSIQKDKLARNGKIWVKMPSLDLRQASGVEFRGKYMTPMEIYELNARRYLYEEVGDG